MPLMKKKTTEKTLLEQRCEEFGLAVPSTYPAADDVLVWRLPPLTERKGARDDGGEYSIIIPDGEETPNVRGLLLAAGFRAMTEIEMQGWRLGHIVLFKRFAGWEHEQAMTPKGKTPEHKRHNQILHIKVGDILGSDDLYDDIRAGRTRFIKDTKSGEYMLEQKPTRLELAEHRESRRRTKLRAIAAQSDSPNEAKVAKRLLKGT